MTDFFTKRVTIYNDNRADGSLIRSFDRHIIEKCMVLNGKAEIMDGTVRRVESSVTVITRDIQHYVPPEKYRKLSLEDRKALFTVKTGDFIVFGEIADAVENAQDFAELQRTYRDNGMKVVSVNTFINGMAVDNITISNA